MNEGLRFSLRPPPFCVALFACAVLTACSGDSGGEGGGTDCPLDCLAAPSPTCDGNTSVRATSPGQCLEDGTCQFAETRTDCGDDATCTDGVCVTNPTPDACDGVSCNTPPLDDCEGPVAVTYANPGTCADGVCSYEETRRDCVAEGLACDDGVCVDVGDLCEGVTCPPIFECEGNVAVEEAGTCVNGSCSYAQVSRQNCEDLGGTCEMGRCQVTNPCEGVVCNSPPAPACDGNQLVSYDSVGLCIDGECQYNENRATCTAGTVCLDAACVPRPVCFGVVCNSPPDNACVGDLAYSYGEGSCELVTNGDGVETEQCVYPETETNCSATDLVCVEGACVEPDPCLGVTCDVADAPFCEGQVAVSFEAPGECIAGVCAFEERREDCSASGGFCEFGECVIEDPCEGVLCNAPPESVCTENVATSYSLPGECVAGDCEYNITNTDCSLDDETCVDGECVFIDVCATESCDPLPPSCLGPLAVTIRGPGTCFIEEGSAVCDYSAVQEVENCSDRGLLCASGECVGAGATLTSGALVITELFVASDAQWVEFLNPGDEPVDIGGLELRNSGGDAVSVPIGQLLGAGRTFVIASDDGTRATIGADLAWGGVSTFAFAAGAGDRVSLFGAEEVAGIDIDASWIEARRSIGVDPILLPAGSTSRSDWCPAVDRITDDFVGSPNATNPACTARVSEGDFVINEIFATGSLLPNGATEEWIELVNVSGSVLDLAGVELWTGSSTHRLSAFEVPAGEFVVIGNGSRVAAGAVDVLVPSVVFAADADTVEVQQTVYNEATDTVGSVLVDGVTYDGAWPLVTGASLSRSSTSSASDDPDAWCGARTTYPSAVPAQGTPGSANDCL